MYLATYRLLRLEGFYFMRSKLIDKLEVRGQNLTLLVIINET